MCEQQHGTAGRSGCKDTVGSARAGEDGAADQRADVVWSGTGSSRSGTRATGDFAHVPVCDSRDAPATTHRALEGLHVI